MSHLKICPVSYRVTLERGPIDWRVILVHDDTGTREILKSVATFDEAFTAAAAIARTAQVGITLDFGSAVRVAGIVEKCRSAK